MKVRSITQKNLAGSFFGGTLGILAFGYLHPIAMVVGCFLGVIVGWWYEIIWQSAMNSFHKSVTSIQKTLKRLKVIILTPAGKFKEIEFNIKPWLSPLLWTIQRPIVIWHWLKTHPMNRVYTVNAFASIAFIGINSLWFIPLGKLVIASANTVSQDSINPLLQLIGMIVILVIAILLPIIILSTPEDGLKGMKRYYQEWEYYDTHNPISFFCKKLIDHFICGIRLSLYSILKLTLLIVAGSTLLTVVFLPLAIVFGLVKGIYKVTTEKGHWLCFGVTLTVTTLSAWLTYPYFGNTQILWIVALLTGTVSAAVTEGLRSSVVWIFNINENLTASINLPIHKHLIPSNKMFWHICNVLDDKYLIPAMMPY